MSELDDVLAALEASDGADAALATVVAVRGSTYRREGARLVVPAGGGPTVGNISGGCLEGDVADTAREVLASGRPALLSFDLTADDEAVWGWGLGCNGAIDVFVEPARQAARFAAAMRTAIAEHRPLALATVVAGGPPGARLVVHLDGRREGSLGDPAVDEEVSEAAAEALAESRSRTVSVQAGWRVFVEALVPPLRLVVCGAGHDAIPLVEFGARLGWRVDVVDDRRAMLVEERFPQASRLVLAQPGEAARAAAVDARTYVVVMSHNFLRDKAYLQSFLGSAVAYLGMLGPRARFERLVNELRAEGVEVDPAELATVHGPAGLDLGAEGPEQIAWAIVAEVLAVSNGAGAGPLRDRPGPIHRREPALGAKA
ncbi:MAG: XdhC family protein [Acidimicrobiia bacterium]